MTVSDQLPLVDGGVRVRQLVHRDAEPFAAGTKDPAVQQYGHLPLAEYTPEIVREQIDGVIADGLSDGSLAVLAIADATADTFLGSVVLFDRQDDHAEVGFWLAPWARGRGAAGQALRAATLLAKRLGLSRLVARTALENEASRRVLTSAGFDQVGEPAEEVAPSGETVTVLRFTCPV